MQQTNRKTSSAEGKQRLVSETYIPRAMAKILGTRDMSATFMVSLYLSTCASTAAMAGPAAISYLVLAGLIFFIPCLIATAQLGSMYPHEGSLYNWTHHAIGGYWSFFSGFCAWFPCVLIVSSLANLFISYTQQLFHSGLTEPWQQSLGICAVLIVGGFTATRKTRHVQNIINVVACMILLSTSIVLFAGFFWLYQGHHAAISFTNWSDWQIQPANFAMFGLLVFSFIGTEGALTMAGEIARQRAIKRHLLYGGTLIFLTYLANTVTVLVVQGHEAANDPLAMVNIVAMVLGQPFAYVAGIGLMGSFFGTILVYNSLYARLLLVASVDSRLPRALGKLNKHRAPANAVIFQTILAVLFTLLIFIVTPLVTLSNAQHNFSSEVYYVTLAAASLVWTVAVIFLFVDLVSCYRKDRQLFLKHQFLPLPLLWASVICGLVSCSLTIGDTLFFSWTELIPDQRWWYLVGSLTLIFLIISAFSSMLGRSEAAWQEMRDTLADSQKHQAVHPPISRSDGAKLDAGPLPIRNPHRHPGTWP